MGSDPFFAVDVIVLVADEETLQHILLSRGL